MPLDHILAPLATLQNRARHGIVGHVRAVFNDQARGEQPVERSADALFAPDSIIWRVHGDVVTMMVGGISALLLQMLHPAVLAGVWDHSNFRTDMLGRLRRTARFIAVTTYGAHDDAEAAIRQVRAVHERIVGTLPDGSTYRAADPHLLAWVHVTEAVSFFAAWQRYGNRRLTRPEQDRYFAEFATVGTAVGATSVPRDTAAASRLIAEMRGELATDHRTREVARMILDRRSANALTAPAQAVTAQAAVDLLPDWARAMHGRVASPILLKPFVRTGTLALARTLRWAFAG